MTTGIYFIGIRQGRQQKVVCSSGFYEALCHVNIIITGKMPNEYNGKFWEFTDNITWIIILITHITKLINKFCKNVSIKI